METRRRPDPNALVAHDTVGALDPEVLHAQAEASVRALLSAIIIVGNGVAVH
jgi:hypothetical protein